MKHWAQGGETRLDNLVLLCRRHHRAVHEGGFRVDAEGRFYYPWGGEFHPAPPLPTGDPDEITNRNRELTIDDRTCAHGSGERMDLAEMVDWMLSAVRVG